MLSTKVDSGASSLPKKRTCPARGKRYSKAQKEEILEYAKANSVEAAASKFNVTDTSIYEWRRALKRRGGKDESAGGEGKIQIEDPKLDRDRRIIKMWRQHPGYGPSQVRNMLKRSGFKVWGPGSDQANCLIL